MIRRPPISTLFPARRSSDLFYLAMRDDVAARYPDDLHAATLAAEAGLDLAPWEAWAKAGTPATYTLEIIRNLQGVDRKSTRLNSSHANISYAVFCLKKKRNH